MNSFSRTSGVPLYLQSVYALRTLIEKEGWRTGSRLPNLEELAARFGVARLTMRQAVKKLEQDGLLTSQRGKGIFVAHEPPQPPRMRVYSDLDELISKSRASSIELLLQEDVTGCPLIPDALPQAHYRRWVRVHADGGIPYGFLDLYLEREAYLRAPERFDREPTMHVLRALPDFTDTSFQQTLTIRPAEAGVARHLQLDPGAPVAHMLRTGRRPDGRTFFAAEVTYPGDQLLIDIVMEPRLRERLGLERED